MGGGGGALHPRRGGRRRTWAHLHDFAVTDPTGQALDVGRDGLRLAEAALAMWDGRAEVDSLNRLVLRAGAAVGRRGCPPGLPPLPEPGGHHVHHPLRRRRAGGERPHRPHHPRAVRGPVRPGAGGGGVDRGGAAQPGDRRVRRRPPPRPRPHPAGLPRPGRRHPAHQPLPAHGVRRPGAPTWLSSSTARPCPTCPGPFPTGRSSSTGRRWRASTSGGDRWRGVASGGASGPTTIAARSSASCGPRC